MLSANAFAQDTNFWIFLCFGQSNMEGFPGIEEQDKTGVDDRFKVFASVDFAKRERTKGHWYPAIPPLCRPSTDSAQRIISAERWFPTCRRRLRLGW